MLSLLKELTAFGPPFDVCGYMMSNVVHRIVLLFVGSMLRALFCPGI